MADDTRRLRVKVTGDPSNRRTLGEIEDGLHDVETASDKAGNSFTRLSDKMSKAGQKISTETAKLHGVTEKFANKSLADMNREIDKLEKSIGNRKNFAKLVASGQQVGADLVENIGKGAAANSKLAMNPAVLAVGGVMAVGLLPIISGAVSAAVLGGAAGGGILGGIKLAAKDPQVKNAAGDLKTYISGQLTDAARPFVPAILNQLPKLRRGFDSISGDLRSVFSKSSTYLGPLTDGLVGLVQKVSPAIKRAVDAAQPVIQAISKELPRMGDAIASALDSISGNGHDAAQAIGLIGNGIEQTIKFTGWLIGELTKLVSVVVDVSATASNFGRLWEWVPGVGKYLKENRERLNEIKDSLHGTADGANTAATATNYFAQKTQSASDKAKEATKQNQGLIDSLTGVKNLALAASNSQIAYEQSIDDGTRALRENGKTLDINTEKGRANKTALNQLAAATNQVTNDTFKQSGSMTQATAAAEAGRKKFIELATKMGLSSKEAKKLADQLIAIPKNNNVKVSTSGVATAKNQLLDLMEKQFWLAHPFATQAQAAEDRREKSHFLASGGSVSGPGSSTSDSIPARLSNGEYVVQAKAVRKYGAGFMNAVNSMKLAAGGLAQWPFDTSAKGTRIPSDAEVRKVAVPALGLAPGWQKMWAVLKNAFPGLSLLSAFRPGSVTLSGNRSYHAVGRAVDVSPWRKVALWIRKNYGSKTKELITPWPELDLRNGKFHDYSRAIDAQHGVYGNNAHVHWAMDGVTQVEPGPFIGVNRTGKTETLVNKDLIQGGMNFEGATFNFYGVQDVKQFRNELLKLAGRNGGRMGLATN